MRRSRRPANNSRKDPANYGKVAKRLYNIFRLTGRWQEAAFVRELFDEPAALLYQPLLESLTSNQKGTVCLLLLTGTFLLLHRGRPLAAQLDRLVADHYQGEAQTLAAGTEENLLKLGELRDKGLISDEEFEAEKQKLLGGGE